MNVKHIILAVLALTMVACATNGSKQEIASTRDETLFNMAGKDIRFSKEFLEQLRSHWTNESFGLSVSSALRKEDLRWVMDFIAALEFINSQGCERLELVAVRPFDVNNDIDTDGPRIKPGLFDYAWVVDVCGESHIYRVFHEIGTTNLGVYPSKL